MTEHPKTETDHISQARAKILDAAVANAVFDGWGGPALAQAISDSGVDAGLAALAFPRGAVDLALAFHKRGDAALEVAAATEDMTHLRYSQKVARLLELRLEAMAPEQEAVRKAVAFFALPQNGADGARAIWDTADLVWRLLGDTSEDVNWYTKRATLSAVWSSAVLFWLGDTSEDFANTRAFITRRIDNVMSFEKFKAQMRKTPLAKLFAAGPGRILERVKAPTGPMRDMPGYMER